MDKNLREMMDHLNQGILILDSRLSIVFLNRAFGRFLGTESQRLLHLPLSDAFPNFRPAYYRRAFQETLENGASFFFSAALHRDLIHGGKRLNLSASRLILEGQNYLLLEFTDVSGEFERIGQLKESVGRLCRLNRNLLEKEREVRRLAYFDSLTGIPNRSLFYELAEELLWKAKREREMLSLLFIDIDKFKGINDTYGHKMGDRVLQQVADILTGSVRKSDVVARYGGDEFLVLLSGIRNSGDCRIIQSKIERSRKQSVSRRNTPVDISFSVGVSHYPWDGETVDELIVKADQEMYAVKREKKFHSAGHREN